MIKRYHPVPETVPAWSGGRASIMEENTYGEYVKYEEYQKLMSECVMLRAEKNHLRKLFLKLIGN